MTDNEIREALRLDFEQSGCSVQPDLSCIPFKQQIAVFIGYH